MAWVWWFDAKNNPKKGHEPRTAQEASEIAQRVWGVRIGISRLSDDEREDTSKPL